MIKTIEVGFPGGKRVDAIIDDRLIKTDQRSENGGESKKRGQIYFPPSKHIKKHGKVMADTPG
jgi:hypothetical protein